MRKRKPNKVLLLVFFLVVGAYTQSLRLAPNEHYGKFFFYRAFDCPDKVFNLDKQIGLLQKSIHYAPEVSDVYASLGNLYVKNGEEEKAILIHQKALELDHKNHDALIGMGVIYFRRNDFVSSQRYLEHARSTGGYSNAYNYYMGRIYERQKNYEQAAYYYHKAYSYAPRHAETWARIAAMEFLLGNEEIVADFTQRLRQSGDPQLVNALDEFMESHELREFRPEEG